MYKNRLTLEMQSLNNVAEAIDSESSNASDIYVYKELSWCRC